MWGKPAKTVSTSIIEYSTDTDCFQLKKTQSIQTQTIDQLEMGTLGSSQYDNSISDMPNSIFYSKKENGLEVKLKDIIAKHLGDSNDKKALTMQQFLNILQNKDEALNFSVE